MIRMSDVAEVYQYVAMDTQFPGIVARPMGPFSDYVEYNYQMLKCNIDLTRVIQIGLTFCDAKGNRPKGISTWRFNFAFDTTKDVFAQESIDGLRQSRGLDLEKHSSQGIDILKFGELLTSSGLVLNDDMRWITYGSVEGFEQKPEEAGPGRPGEPAWAALCGLYDFGHLLQLLMSQNLPDEVSGFQELLDIYFPSRCDIARHVHRLPALGDGAERRRPFFKNAHHLLEAFFRLPDSVRRSGFDPEEPSVPEDTEAPVGAEKQKKRRNRAGKDKER